MIIIVAGVKGGTGKTTIATNFAVMRAKEGCEVLLIDADSQMSSSDFIAVRQDELHDPKITCITSTGRDIKDEISKLEQKYDDVIVDVGGRDSTTLRSSLVVGDVLVVPCLTSQLDVWALEHMDTIVKEAMDLNENLRSIVFLNKVDTNPKINITQETEELISSCNNIKYCDAKISSRIAFRRAVAEGISVLDLQGVKKDKKAIEEIKKLYNEVFKDA